MDKIVNAFDTSGDLIHQDNKDTLPKMVCNLKKIMVKHWASMELADLEVIIRLISDPGCLHLQQHMTREGPEAVDLVQDIPEPWAFLHKLPEKQCRREETEMIVFDIQSHIRGLGTPVNSSHTLQFSCQNYQQRDISHHPKCSCQTPGSTECAREVPEPCDQPCSANNGGTKNGES